MSAPVSQLTEWSLFERIFGTAPVGIGLLDPDLRFVGLNEALARGNGVSREEHLGRRIDEVWPGIHEELLTRLRALVETGEPITDVEVVSERGGAPRHVLGSYYPVPAADGTISGVGIIVLDITERKLAEEALNASEQRQREILENAQVIAVIVDHQSRIVYCNPFLAELSGWTREELLGREWYETFTPFAAGEPRERFIRHIAEGAVNPHADGPLLTRSGEWRLISWNNTVIRDRQGRGIGATSIGEDITERRLAEKELRTRAEEQAALRRVATLAAGEARPERIFLSVATEAASILGAGSSAVLRFDDPETVTVVGQWDDAEPEGFPIGSTIPLAEDGALRRLLRAGEPVRVDDQQGSPGELPESMRSIGFRSVAATPVVVANRLWGALVVGSRCAEPVPADGERRLGEFAEVLGLAVASADAREKLARSRARIVEASDEARRGLERDLHDGAQQRLVSLAVLLRLAEARLASDPLETASALARASAELEQAIEELRRLARGIHPAILSDRGLTPALEALAARMPLPVAIRSAVATRLPPAVEVATYYVVSEGLTNVVKHARASHATVTVTHSNGTATVEVADDGIGGAELSLRSGLNGLQDRVEALGGKLEVASQRGAGTSLRAEIPCTFVGDHRLPIAG